MSAPLRYDEDLLGERLDHLDDWGRAAFALACAQRLLPLYLKYCDVAQTGDPGFAMKAADDLWRSLRSPTLSRDELERVAARSEELVPDGQAVGVTVWHWYAMDAMAAVAYAAQAQLTGETDKAVWAARQAHEAAALYVRRRDRLNLRSESEAALLDRDPVVQEELSRQDRDLDMLGGDTPRDAKLSDLRHSAQEAHLFELDSVT